MDNLTTFRYLSFYRQIILLLHILVLPWVPNTVSASEGIEEEVYLSLLSILEQETLSLVQFVLVKLALTGSS